MKFNSNKAIFLQISDYICEQVLLNKFKPGDRIPSIREMAVEMEVNPNTVTRTYQSLQDKKIIYNKRGIGYFISEHGDTTTKEISKKDFVNNQLPYLFKEMKLLDISISEISNLYEKFEMEGAKQ